MENDQERHEELDKTACDAGVHAFPEQEFVVGARVCDLCGVKEY